jgi:MraZ protein
MGFIGHERTSVDTKRRLVIAARFRRALDPSACETFVMTRGLDSCIYAYPQNEWQRVCEKLDALPLGRSQARAFQRAFFHYASECPLDAQGRLLIPQQLADLAGITEASGALVKGTGDHLEIWNPAAWDTYQEEHSANGHTYESVAEELFSGPDTTFSGLQKLNRN